MCSSWKSPPYVHDIIAQKPLKGFFMRTLKFPNIFGLLGLVVLTMKIINNIISNLKTEQ